jgi:hypothetical protein
MRAGVGRDVGGIPRQRRSRGNRAGPNRAVGARKNLRRQHLAARFLIFEEQRLSGNSIAGIEDQTVALEAVHLG